MEKILQSRECNLEIQGKRYSAKAIEKACRMVNPSLYLFKADVFYQGIAMIDNNNAQAEYYLTDVVKHLAGVKDDNEEMNEPSGYFNRVFKINSKE